LSADGGQVSAQAGPGADPRRGYCA